MYISICRGRRPEIKNCMTPTLRVLNFWAKTVKLMQIFKKKICLSTPKLIEVKINIMMSMEAFTKTINFVTPGAGFPVLGPDHFGHIVKLITSLKISENLSIKVMMSLEASTKIVNFITPMVGFLLVLLKPMCWYNYSFAQDCLMLGTVK